MNLVFQYNTNCPGISLPFLVALERVHRRVPGYFFFHAA